MRDFLARSWFLLLLTAGVAVAAARPDVLRPLTGRLPLRPVVALTLFLTALGLDGRRLWVALARPAPVVWALAVSYGAVPALAWAAGRFLPINDLQLGLFVIACGPCTLSSAVVWTRLAGGNDALALLVVVASTALSWLVTTLWLTLATGQYAA